MIYLKSYKLFESRIEDMEANIRDILLELEDEGFQIEIDRTRKDVDSGTKGYTDTFIEVRIKRPWGSPDRVIPNAPIPPSGKYHGGLFIWREVKDTIIRLNDWYYDYSGNDRTPGINYDISSKLSKIGIKVNTNSPFRMFDSGIEFGIGWCKSEDFNHLGDFISFTSIRIEMKV